jgi:uncharacterized membrane protein YdjX (TVP38/TMEM64 family)
MSVAEKGAGRRMLLRFVFLAAAGSLFVAGVLWLKRVGAFERALQWLSSLGPWAPIAFFALYIVAVVLMVPASIFTMGAGALFGFVRGGAYVLASATVASVICFLIARHFARGWIANKLRGNRTFMALDEAIAREGWKIVFLVRLAPVLPFSFTSYGFGITQVPLWQYLAASIAMVPGTLWYVYLGTLLGDLAGISKPALVPVWGRIAIAVTAFAVMFYLARFVKRALARNEKPG